MGAEPKLGSIIGKEGETKNFFQNRISNELVLAYRSVYVIYKDKMAPKVPIFEKFRTIRSFESILCKIACFWGKFSADIGGHKSLKPA